MKHDPRCPVALGEAACKHGCRCYLRIVTERRGESTADACRRLGWGPGTRLVGCEGYGPTTIRITAVGEQNILAVCESRGSAYEGNWTLSCRDWQPVGGDS